VLSAEGAPLIIAPVDGVALFPKYVAPGQAPPPELVRIAVAVDDPHRELV
jgi:hypothetical protein